MTVKELRRLLRKIPSNSKIFVCGGSNITASFAQNERGEWIIELKMGDEAPQSASSTRTPQVGSEGE